MPGYPTPPGTRIAYELDGSQVFIKNASTKASFDVHPNAVKGLNSEYAGGLKISGSLGWGPGATSRDLTVIFPNPRELTAIHAMQNDFYSTSVMWAIAETWVSPDSTNGVDGIWTQVSPRGGFNNNDGTEIGGSYDALTGAIATGGNTNQNNGFTNVTKEFKPYDAATNPYGYFPLSGTSVRQVRAVQLRVTQDWLNFSGNSVLKLHIYGKDDTLANTRRIEFWKPSTDLRIDGGDLWWSDIPQASSAQKSFRLKNMSPTLTATGLVVSTDDAASSTTPDPQSFYTFSLDGGTTWNNIVYPPNLSPGAISGTILIRAVVPSNAKLSRWSPKVTAEVGAWT